MNFNVPSISLNYVAVIHDLSNKNPQLPKWGGLAVF
jgi:hypothetical protein